MLNTSSLPLLLGVVQGLLLDNNELHRSLKSALNNSFKKLLQCSCPVEKKNKSRTFVQTLNHFLKKISTRTGWKCRKPRHVLRPLARKLDRIVDKVHELKNPLCFHSFEEGIPRVVNNILDVCSIHRPLEYQFVLPPWSLKRVRKITEGSYGEIYVRDSPDGRDSILKIMAVHGKHRENPDLCFELQDAVGDPVCSKHLSTLSTPGKFYAPNFPVAYEIQLVKGKPCEAIVGAWKRYKEDPNTEDTSFFTPDHYTKDSLFLILEIENCGRQFIQNNNIDSMQAVSMILQTASALAVAESAFEFEHRDLHVGNWLYKDTTETEITYSTPNRKWIVPSYNIKAYIIDFTMSRINADGNVFAMDLSSLNYDQPVEQAQNTFTNYNYVYTVMMEEFEDGFQSFNPKTNVWWLTHLCTNALEKLKDQFEEHEGSEADQIAITTLENFERNLMLYTSSMDFLQACYFGRQSSEMSPLINSRLTYPAQSNPIFL